MRVLGYGHIGIEKFTQLINLPKLMTPKSYSKVTTKVKNIVKSMTDKTMSNAANEMRENVTDDDIVDVGNSCDGSWQKRGFQSRNGVFTSILIESGKITHSYFFDSINRILVVISLPVMDGETDMIVLYDLLSKCLM